VSLTRFDQLEAVRAGIAAAFRVYGQLKIDTVVIRGVNDDELTDLIEFGRSVNAEVRFIEYMDVGGASRWSPARVVSRDDILATLTKRYGAIAAVSEPGSSAPAERLALPDGTTFGIIASTTEPFCANCDRSRLTADGMWYLCLYATQRHRPARTAAAGRVARGIRQLITGGWQRRDDRAPRIVWRSAISARSCRYRIY
jgi:cyclic pyranopterin phosphate synthase